MKWLILTYFTNIIIELMSRNLALTFFYMLIRHWDETDIISLGFISVFFACCLNSSWFILSLEKLPFCECVTSVASVFFTNRTVSTLVHTHVHDCGPLLSCHRAIRWLVQLWLQSPWFFYCVCSLYSHGQTAFCKEPFVLFCCCCIVSEWLRGQMCVCVCVCVCVYKLWNCVKCE